MGGKGICRCVEPWEEGGHSLAVGHRWVVESHLSSACLQERKAKGKTVPEGTPINPRFGRILDQAVLLNPNNWGVQELAALSGRVLQVHQFIYIHVICVLCRLPRTVENMDRQSQMTNNP